MSEEEEEGEGAVDALGNEAANAAPAKPTGARTKAAAPKAASAKAAAPPAPDDDKSQAAPAAQRLPRSLQPPPSPPPCRLFRQAKTAAKARAMARASCLRQPSRRC